VATPSRARSGPRGPDLGRWPWVLGVVLAWRSDDCRAGSLALVRDLLVKGPLQGSVRAVVEKRL
jgi:hypothetical protein